MGVSKPDDSSRVCSHGADTLQIFSTDLYKNLQHKKANKKKNKSIGKFTLVVTLEIWCILAQTQTAASRSRCSRGHALHAVANGHRRLPAKPSKYTLRHLCASSGEGGVASHGKGCGLNVTLCGKILA